MTYSKIRTVLAAILLGIATTLVAVVVQASPASAENGGCPDRAHNVHTADTQPYRGWACWIDNGDDIRVCDNAPNDGTHIHADLWFDAGGFWYHIVGEDDGDDAGCDDEDMPNGGDLQGTNRLRLRVCVQNASQVNSLCKEVIWMETE